MKTLQTSILLLALTQLAWGEPPKTEADLISAFREALTSQNSAMLDEMTFDEGMSEQDKAMSAQSHQRIVQMAAEIEDIRLEPLPADFQALAVMHGKRIEMTANPQGMIHVRFTGGQATATPYAIVGEHYFLAGPKSSDLGWAGPPDKNIAFSLSGQGLDGIQILVSWNASGVVQEREFTETSSSFWGQHVESVTVVSNAEDAVCTLTVLEEGEAIFQSETISGKGKIEYKRNG